MTITDQPDLSEIRGHDFFSLPLSMVVGEHQKLEKYIHDTLAELINM